MQTSYKPPANTLLWFSILAGPAAWAAHLTLEYFLTTAECFLAAGNTSPAALASSIGLASLAVLGIVAGLLARRDTSESEDTRAERRRFMATAGALLSAFFLTGIVMATIPIAFLEACRAGV